MRNETRLRSISFCAAILLLISDYAMAGTWTSFDMPGASTYVYGISGGNIVGQYSSGGFRDTRGFIYNGTSWTTLNAPGSWDTYAYGISGDNVVGYYDRPGPPYDESFRHIGSTWKIIGMPGGEDVRAYGIDGDNIVGIYQFGGGFLYIDNDKEPIWTIFNVPGASGTYPYDIDGGKIVGACVLGVYSGFLYSDGTFTILNAPGANLWTYARGISGNNIVGNYTDSSGLGRNHGFLYNGSTWTTLDAPWGYNTYATGIDGSNIVGYYYNPTQSKYCGFVYTIPEPATLLLLAFGGLILRRK